MSSLLRSFSRLSVNTCRHRHPCFSPTIRSSTAAAKTSQRAQARAAQAHTQTSRSFTSTPVCQIGLDEFRDTVPRQKRLTEPVGRRWTAKELRRKSYDDLHKLWYVLYKESNMLLTEANLARRKGIKMVQPDRRKKVKKSMAAIKVVLGERKRAAIQAFEMRKKMEEQEQEHQQQPTPDPEEEEGVSAEGESSMSMSTSTSPTTTVEDETLNITGKETLSLSSGEGMKEKTTTAATTTAATTTATTTTTTPKV